MKVQKYGRLEEPYLICQYYNTFRINVYKIEKLMIM